MIQAYIGDGKGKTTAALGLVIRALGAGLRGKIIYFDKGGSSSPYHERQILEKLKVPFEITGLDRMSENGKFRFGVSEGDKIEALRGVSLARTSIQSGNYDLLVLDEILSAITFGLLSSVVLDELFSLVNDGLELVLTGRFQSDKLPDKVHLISRIEKVRHYFDQGLSARPGIEF
ncbi:cob(I)yrinic acid a,c-diamide adenosyltransferase [bacterium]|nr:cob(I)yrinic acid a,c-diamide adenosyltransferase [bacterium]